MIHKYLTRIEDIEGRDKAFVVIRRLLISSLRLCRNTKVCTKYTALQPGLGRGGGRGRAGEGVVGGSEGSLFVPGYQAPPSCPPAPSYTQQCLMCYGYVLVMSGHLK